MRSTLILSAFAALALAAPRPQDINFQLVDDAPDIEIITPSVDAASEAVPVQPLSDVAAIAAASVTDVAYTKEERDFFEAVNNLKKRVGDCSALPTGTGPQISTPADDDTSFLAYEPFHNNAKNAALPANIPKGYSLSFFDLKASSQTVSYLGFETISTYDPVKCASICDQKDGCVAFNLYYERDPSLKSNDDQCPNAPSVTNIKCVRWGVHIGAETAKNDGQYRSKFHVVISGSNGYNKNKGSSTQIGFQGPVPLAGAINAPFDPITHTNTYMGYKFFSFADIQTYDKGAVACTQACTVQTAYNSRHPPQLPALPSVCNQVVVYVLSNENQPQGIYCAMYTEQWAAVYATNYGQYRGDRYWGVSQAYAYTNNTYAAQYQPICAKSECPVNSYKGGNCGGYGAGTC